MLEAATRAPGGAWSAPVPVGDSTADAETPQVGVDAAGNALLTWRAKGPGDYLRYATKPAGGPWSAADDVTDPAEGIVTNEYELVVTPSGQATVVWEHYLPMPTDRRVIQAATRQAGGAFGDPETISSATTNTWSPVVAVNDAGVATATWHQDTATADSDVKAATRTPDGTWSAAEDVSAAGGDDDAPDVVVDSAGTATAVWNRYDGLVGKLQYSSRPAGGTWSEPAGPHASGDRRFRHPSLAIDPSDRITAVYVVFSGPGSVVTASTRAPGEPWAAGVPLSPSGDGSASEAEVAMDDAGQATVIWLRTETPPGYVLETRSLDTQAPLASGLSLPAATVGTPVTLSWPAVDAWSPIASIAWSFGDGGTGSGPSVTRTFATVGSYAVSVTATDAAGYSTTLTGTVVVSPAPPVTPTTPTTPATPRRPSRSSRG